MGQQTSKYHISDNGKVYSINDDGSFTECEIVPKPEINTISNADSTKPNSKVRKSIIISIFIAVLIGISLAVGYCLSFDTDVSVVDLKKNESLIEDYDLGTVACSWDGDINNHYTTAYIGNSDETYTSLSEYLNFNYYTNSDIAFNGDKFTMSFDINITDTNAPQNLFEIVDGSWRAIPLFTVYYDTNALFVRTFTRYDYQETVGIAENDNDNGKFSSVEVLSDLKKNEWRRVSILYDKGDVFVNNQEFMIPRFPKIFDKKDNKYRYFISCELPYQNQSILLKNFVMTIE